MSSLLNNRCCVFLCLTIFTRCPTVREGTRRFSSREKKRRSGRTKGRGENSGWEDKVMEEKRWSSIHRWCLNYLPPPTRRLASAPSATIRATAGNCEGAPAPPPSPSPPTAQVFALSHLRGTAPTESPKTGRQSAVSAGSPWIPAGGKQAALLLCSESEGGGGGVCLFCLLFSRKWNLKSAQSCQNEGAGSQTGTERKPARPNALWIIGVVPLTL